MTARLTDTDIARIAHGLIDRTLPRADWTHAAHFAAALWMHRHRPDLATPEAFGALIIAYNSAVGVENTDSSGYHATITIASLRASAALLASHAPDATLADVLAGLLSGPLGRSDWLLVHWSRPVLFSVAARRGWVPPDLSPLPG